MKNFDSKQIIEFAIDKEIEAYEFYKGVSEKVTDSNLKRIFSDLADEENKHRLILEDFASDKRPVYFDEVKDYKISQTIDKPKLSLDMKPVDAIALAVKNEEDAMNFYTSMVYLSTDAEQKKVFQALAAMEGQHKVKLEETFTNMAFPEAW